LPNFCLFSMAWTSDFNNVYLKYFVILQNLMRNYEILWKFTKVNKSYDIPRYFLSKITYFHSILFNCNALLAFRDISGWQTKFFCLLSYRFAFRRHRQIFCHHQIKGNLQNIADTLLVFLPTTHRHCKQYFSLTHNEKRC